jgi:hypothetical protein
MFLEMQAQEAAGRGMHLLGRAHNYENLGFCLPACIRCQEERLAEEMSTCKHGLPRFLSASSSFLSLPSN